MPDTHRAPTGAKTDFDVVVVGAGFAGMYMLHKLREQNLKVRVYETASGVGGTWYWNRYPGARCDVESIDYSFSFSPEIDQEWTWTERYSTQAEILRYLNYVADRLDLRRDMQFKTGVTKATFDESGNIWKVETDDGKKVTAKYFIMAVGCLASATRLPDIKGLNSFKGKWYHTGAWPHETVDFTGKRVAVIGTGSSGVQAIPEIAKQAKHLSVFQRTPNFSLPARNKPLETDFVKSIKATYPDRRTRIRDTVAGVFLVPAGMSALQATPEERQKVFEERWQEGGGGVGSAYADLMVNLDANATAAEFVRAKIKSIVKDPAMAALLAPTDHPIGTKRLCLDSYYYETYNRPNVDLVNIRNSPIEEITPKGVRVGGKEYEVDAIVFATGFDAMTGPVLRVDIKGKNGASLREAWHAGPRTYLGLMMVGFPNLFTLTGPGSPSVLTNVVQAIEQHVEWVAACIKYLRGHHIDTMEAQQDAQDAWVDHVNAVANMTLYPQANSWYMGANIPGKARVFMPYVGGLNVYRKKCDEVAAKGYEGFTLTATAPAK